MFQTRSTAIIGAILFFVLSLLGLSRLLFWYPIVILGHHVGQTTSFLVFVVFGALGAVAIKDFRRSE